MKKLLYILLFVPFTLFGQENDPCYSLNNIYQEIEEYNPPLSIDLNVGWNLIGYPCAEGENAEAAFNLIVENIEIVKNNGGYVYWPEFDFNGIGDLNPGQGYQIKLYDIETNFSFCNSISFPEVLGCTYCESLNFNPFANIDDGSCISVIEGCMNPVAINYDFNANLNINCEYYNTSAISDSNFLYFLNNNYPSLIVNDSLNIDEASQVSFLEIFDDQNGISNIDELEYFVNLDTLIIEHLDIIPDITALTNLDRLTIRSSNFSSLNLSGLINLTYLELMNVDSIIQLDLAELINLESLKIRLNDNLESVSGMNNLMNLSFTSFIGNPNLECLEGIPPFYDLAASAPPLCLTNEDILNGNISNLEVIIDSLQTELDSITLSGCSDILACNYHQSYVYDDGSCVFPEEGYNCQGDFILSIGDFAFGGIIFQINQNGSGMVAAPEDIGAFQWDDALTDASSYTYGGYNSGWYLPGLNELELMYNTIGQGGTNVGNFANSWYWSCWQYSNMYSYHFNFNTGSYSNTGYKSSSYQVRPIRSF